MSQTAIVDADALRWGSAKVQAALKSDGFGSLQELGAIRNLVISETADKVKTDSDNAGTIATRIKGQMVNVKFDWLEPNMTKWYMLRGHLDSYAVVTTTPVAITDEEVVLTDIDFTRLAFKTASGAVVTGITVTTNAATPVTLTKDTDYTVAVDSEGWTGIARIDGGAITTADTVLVDYTYTPASSLTRSTGGNYTILPVVLRFINTSESGDENQIDIYEATFQFPMTWTFKSDESDDVNVMPVVFEGVNDESRTAGDQLYKETDAQTV